MTDDSGTRTLADTHDFIRVIGARENNLRDVSIDLPKRRLIAFTGVSGSGKTSLVFDTIAAESQRLINETYSTFAQSFMPRLPRPEVDVLEGITTAIAVDQKALGADPRSTVGTVTDAGAMLRILFSQLGEPHIGSPQTFSFNVASASGAGALTTQKGGRTVKERKTFNVVGGMCPECEGRGLVTDFNMDAIVDRSKTLNEGAILVPGYSMDGWYGRIFGDQFDMDKPVGKFTDKEMERLLYSGPKKIKVEGVNLTFEGLIPRMKKSILSKEPDAMQPHVRQFVERAVVFKVCPVCDGTRLSELARSSKITGLSIADVSGMQVDELSRWIRTVDGPRIAPLIEKLSEALDSFVEIGLGYLSLNRSASTLSGGEAQRVKMVRQLGSALTDVTYVFDEPTNGLHPHDVGRMNAVLARLRDKGNTVLVVEHEPSTIAAADLVVDMGPGGGSDGGEVCFVGTPEQLRQSATLTGQHMADLVSVKQTVREPSGAIEIRGADLNNLKNVDVDVPLAVLTAITGVAGSGKSSLVSGSLAPRDDVVLVTQEPIRGSRRSNPATYTGLLDPVRTAFGKANGVKPALFSFNSDGACPECGGAGYITTQLGFMASVETVCELCEGTRYKDEVLAYRLGTANIVEVLAMTAKDASAYFALPESNVPKAKQIADRLVDVGLGYITLGQPLSTLSGGERQRLKLAVQLGLPGDIYVLDEPTAGLHMADVDNLLGLLDRIVDSGKTVVVVEHNLAVVGHSDWVIDMGPEAGSKGGEVVFEGTPAQLATAETLTGTHLAAALE